MASLQKIAPKDVDLILPLLAKFDASHAAAMWRNLFQSHTGGPHDHCGYALVDGGHAVGFLGYTFSERTVRGAERRFCNINNWIVQPEHRHASLTLLMPALKLTDTTVTNFTPTPEVRRICAKLGFQPLDGTQRLILPGSGMGARLSGARILTGSEVRNLADSSARRLLDDHALPHHRHAMIRTSDGDCLLIMNRTQKRVRGRPMPMLHCHHVGNRSIFNRAVGLAATVLCAKFGAAAMIVMERYFDRFPRLSLQRPGGRFEAGFRPCPGVTEQDIDGLYSELSLLNY